MKNTLSTVSKLIAIAIDDRKATIEIAIGDLFWNGDRDRDRDLKFDKDRDRDRDRNFRDRTNTLFIGYSAADFENSMRCNLLPLWTPQKIVEAGSHGPLDRDTFLGHNLKTYVGPSVGKS